MKIKFSKERIEFEKNLSNIDKFVMDFILILNKLKINYVLGFKI